MRIEILETRLELHRFVCASLELEMEFATSEGEKVVLARRRIEAIQGCSFLSLTLDLLKNHREPI